MPIPKTMTSARTIKTINVVLIKKFDSCFAVKNFTSKSNRFKLV
ncbi:MAG: hypothetical protein ACD_67C00017G0004 [uncultured bacterium]|nr:MAG: hypothetical protein ACD_67C00017G0004 [uncultured bacterium]